MSDPIEEPQEQLPDSQNTEEQDIVDLNEVYNQKAKEFSDKFEEVIGPDMRLAIAVIMDNDFPEAPITYVRGSKLALARLSNHLAKRLRQVVIDQIEG